MRKVLFLMSLIILVFLTACNSTESEEIETYQKNFNDKVMGNMEKVEEIFFKIDETETEAEEIAIIEKEFIPVIEDIEKHLESQKPKYEDTQDYHNLRLAEYKTYVELTKRTMKSLAETLGNELAIEEFQEIASTNAFLREEEYEKLKIKADEKMEELAQKHNIILNYE